MRPSEFPSSRVIFLFDGILLLVESLLVVGREAEDGGNAEWQLGRDPRLTVEFAYADDDHRQQSDLCHRRAQKRR